MMKLSMSSDEKDDLDLNNCLQKEVEKALEVWGSIEGMLIFPNITI